MLFARKKLTPEEEGQLIAEVLRLLDELWQPIRFMTDLESVWPELSEKERGEITESYVYRERLHEKRAEKSAEALQQALEIMPGGVYRDVRSDIGHFLRRWRSEEPDTLKILAGRLRNARERAESAG